MLHHIYLTSMQIIWDLQLFRKNCETTSVWSTEEFSSIKDLISHMRGEKTVVERSNLNDRKVLIEPQKGSEETLPQL